MLVKTTELGMKIGATAISDDPGAFAHHSVSNVAPTAGGTVVHAAPIPSVPSDFLKKIIQMLMSLFGGALGCGLAPAAVQRRMHRGGPFEKRAVRNTVRKKEFDLNPAMWHSTETAMMTVGGNTTTEEYAVIMEEMKA